MAKLLDNPSSTLGQTGNIFWQSWLYKLWVAVTQGLVISSASQTVGVATLVAGTVTVPCPVIQTTSLVLVSYQTRNNPGILDVPLTGINPGVSFVIRSTVGTDVSTVVYTVIQPV